MKIEKWIIGLMCSSFEKYTLKEMLDYVACQ